MLKLLLPILLFTSCVTTNKVKRYMREHPEKAAEICLEQFPQESKSDTVRIVKDSLIFEAHIDTFYNWLKEEHFIDSVIIKEKIKTLVKLLKDTVVITETRWDDRYKVLYETKDKEFIILEDRYNRNKKSLFYTWLWIGIIGVGIVAYKRYV